MKTTLLEIKKHNPCTDGWKKLLISLNKTKADNEPLDLMHILKSNGIKDAIWCLRCFDYLDYCLLLADIAEPVAHLTNNKDAENAIKGIRAYKKGEISKGDLKKLADAAADSAYAAADAAADSAYAAAAGAAGAGAASARKNKWLEIERLFIKYFGGES